MKISIDLEATPDEVREFFGWPPIQPVQQELIRVMQENMNKGVAGFEPLNLIKSLFPMPMPGLENMQKAFSDAVNAAGGTKASEKAARKNPSLAILFYCYAIGPPLWSNPFSREKDCVMHITFEQTQRAVAAALRKAREIDTRMCIAVVDSGADLKAFVPSHLSDVVSASDPKALPGRADAHGRCLGRERRHRRQEGHACFFGMPTGEIGKLSQPGGSLYGIEHSNQGLITFLGVYRW